MAGDFPSPGIRPLGDLSIDYAGELNAEQLAAVTAPLGPALVLAGAGTGKTRTLIYRVAYLIEQGIPPERILLLTFTNKAAAEMMHRVSDLLGREYADLMGGTFHSVGNRILRSHAELLGYSRHFTILDRDDSEALLLTACKELGWDNAEEDLPTPAVLSEIVSYASSTALSVPEVLAQRHADLVPFESLILESLAGYAKRKRDQEAMDFDDLLLNWLDLLVRFDSVREHYQRRFVTILVDEYQDTNVLQCKIVDLLASRHGNIMAVGDDAQSIYSWRGADVRNIRAFPGQHPGAVIHKVETNYRSTPEILAVANAILANATDGFEKQLKGVRRSGARPALVPCADATLQSAAVATQVWRLHEEGVALSDIAILYRSHFHALELQMEFNRLKIPYAISSGLRFFEQAHMKDAAAHLRFVVNPEDEPAFERLVRMLPGVGAKASARLWAEWSLSSRARASGELIPASNSAGLGERLGRLDKIVPKRAKDSWAQFVETMRQMEDARGEGPSRLLQVAVEGSYTPHLQAAYTNWRARLDDLNQMARYAQQFQDAAEFLSQLALASQLDAEHQSGDGQEEGVRFMTVHQSKGLEFAAVFVVMLNEGYFPSRQSQDDPLAEAEERRLFYVAVTRARDHLYLCFPLMRTLRDSQADARQRPSPFLAELPTGLVDEWPVLTTDPF